MSWLSGIFGGKKLGAAHLGVLKTDLHSHLLPAIDDGSTSVENSLELIEQLLNFGYTKLITTPHVMGDHYRNTPKTINQGLDLVKEALDKRGIDVVLEAAAEYYCDSDFDKIIDAGDILTISGKYVLVELSYLNHSEQFDSLTFKLQSRGYVPILAHPERYPYFYQSIDKLEAFREKGILLQVNLASLTGHYGSGPRRMVERLIENNMVDFLGSDTHKLSHIDVFKKAVTEKYLHQLLNSELLKNQAL